MCCCCALCAQLEYTARLDFLWRVQAKEEINEMKELREHNENMLRNILPSHVARHFLEKDRDNEVRPTGDSFLGVWSLLSFSLDNRKSVVRYSGVFTATDHLQRAVSDIIRPVLRLTIAFNYGEQHSRANERSNITLMTLLL